MTDNYFFILIITFLLSLFFQNHLRQTAKKVGLVDNPCERKNHQGVIPLSGGIAIFLAFSFSVLLLNESITDIRIFFSGAMILVVVGVLDDLHDIKPSYRIYMQILVGFILFQFNHIQILDFGELLVPGNTLELKSFSLPITIIAVVGVINAFNMLDGIDGLAGAVATIIFLTLAILALLAGDISSFQLLGILSMSTFVFILFNWRFYNNKKALVFMGDSGSLFIGFVIAYYLIKLSQGEHRVMLPTTALWIFAFPIIDTMTMMFRRLIKGRSPFLADREHFHHLLQQAGFGIHTTTLIIIMINVVCIAIGIAIGEFKLTESYMFYAFLMLFIIYYYIIMRSWKVKRFLKRQFHNKG
jgi:UDP-GlcNAc:undecaprenyl-phosphate/decaprenyl-phosphate GlcNAc-1-phosphate transferase